MSRIVTVLLCGGKGTRAYPHTMDVPKPLLEVADRPILEHVMELYAAQGFTDFILSAGYKHEMVAEFARTVPASWDVEVVDTGLDTNTGDRVAAVRDLLDDTFFVNYADGVGNVDLNGLLDSHRSYEEPATLTCVPLRSQYGILEFDGDGRVRSFREKPRLPEHLVNAGFFVFDPTVFDHWEGEDLEREVLPVLGKKGLLRPYHHHGFWRSMDTYKDALQLTALCEAGSLPWMSLASSTPQ